MTGDASNALDFENLVGGDAVPAIESRVLDTETPREGYDPTRLLRCVCDDFNHGR